MKKLLFIILATVLNANIIDYSDLKGYTLIEVKKVQGTFNGCNYDTKIVFTDNTTVTCSTYTYAYAFNPEAAIFAQKTIYKGKDYMLLKMIVNDKIYDLSPQSMK